MPELVNSRPATIGDLWREAERGTLYAVLDACDEPRVPAKVAELGGALAVSLYRGAAETDLSAIAPYLVHVQPGTLYWITQELWTDPWGIFALSDAGIETVRTHFRKFLMVDAPNGERWYFRFYDPRVLARYLPTCDAAGLTDFFGPVDTYGWTDLATYGVTLATRQWHDAPMPAKPRITLRRP